MFVILSFVVLFYSFGYKYNPNEGKIIQTGAIILHTFPDNAQIYLDGRPVQKNSGLINLFGNLVKIEGLEPRNYEVSVKLKDFSTWVKKVKIENDHVIEFKNIILTKSKIENKIISKNIEQSENKSFWVNKNKNKIAYIKIQNDTKSLFTLDLEKGKESALYDLGRIFNLSNSKNLQLQNIIWSENDNKILALAEKDKKYIATVIDLANNNALFQLTDSSFSGNEYNTIQLTDSLFYIENNSLYKSSFTKSKIATTRALNGISGYLIKDGSIYYTKTESNSLFKNNVELFDSESIVSSILDDFETGIPSKIIKYENNFLVLADKKLFLIDNSGQTWKISANADDADFFDGSNRILYSNSNEIWVYYIKEKKSQPQKQDHLNELITRYSGNINNIFIYKDNEHIFYKEGYVFKFAELDERGARNVFDIVSVKNGDILYKADDNSVIYIENSNLIRSSLDGEK